MDLVLLDAIIKNKIFAIRKRVPTMATFGGMECILNSNASIGKPEPWVKIENVNWQIPSPKQSLFSTDS